MSMETNAITTSAVSELSSENTFVGDIIEQTTIQWQQKWEKLISQTNWEKGKLIFEWRTELIQKNAAATAYSDETWSRKVGAVTPQHVGRLRRVYERFNDTRDQYSQLFWSHFQAALDWDDAALWLEGAALNGWSISQMRVQRWESQGAPADKKPKENEVFSSDVDEDVNPLNDEPSDSGKNKGAKDDSVVESTEARVKDFDTDFGAAGPLDEKPDFGDESSVPFQPDPLQPGESAFAPPKPEVEISRPFEDIPDLPADLTNAFDLLKIAILNHKLGGWKEVSCDDVCAALNGMKQLAMNK